VPGIRRQKECPNCSIKHRRRGPFCSKGCANSARIPTEGMIEHMRKVVTEYNKTPESIGYKKLFHTGMSPNDYAVDIPDFYDMPDGYEKSEDW